MAIIKDIQEKILITQAKNSKFRKSNFAKSKTRFAENTSKKHVLDRSKKLFKKLSKICEKINRLHILQLILKPVQKNLCLQCIFNAFKHALAISTCEQHIEKKLRDFWVICFRLEKKSKGTTKHVLVSQLQFHHGGSNIKKT